MASVRKRSLRLRFRKKQVNGLYLLLNQRKTNLLHLNQATLFIHPLLHCTFIVAIILNTTVTISNVQVSTKFYIVTATINRDFVINNSKNPVNADNTTAWVPHYIFIMALISFKKSVFSSTACFTYMSTLCFLYVYFNPHRPMTATS